MGKVAEKKTRIVQRITEYLLQHGLHESSIRNLAEAAGTSDRMLIYYFGSKDGLLNVVLGAIADGLGSQLDAAFGTQRRSAETMFAQLTDGQTFLLFKPVIQLWFELVGLSVRGVEPYATNAFVLGKNWMGWMEGRLEDSAEVDVGELFGRIEGNLMLKLIQSNAG